MGLEHKLSQPAVWAHATEASASAEKRPHYGNGLGVRNSNIEGKNGRGSAMTNGEKESVKAVNGNGVAH